MTCKRCGTDTPRLTLDQRYCPQCAREVAYLTTPRQDKGFRPRWRDRVLTKDMTDAVLG